ncbi:unnamed protein product [Fusarium graminearum]|uniref:Chromosome 1, complete genome n=2 Tax=Gibberella zeae TaxID=5518 RepID=I1RAB1_GIBZE|nr:hypothetical protein FGSG_00438 [Fusarium graminearum PH-1]EYB30742.1 hypothetical protein FG05_00438 [Fusarium graminearum]ESU05622.1 hypothetical protein FGSG_00438 [Fusarium graminearum PH-1]PCD18319.1 hypothetical protein FGRA07_06956 [Fusarium graminearum]CAF3553380.1 unnamed protein product [Fusarium graminearum]CAF3577891.1 unnamed protein product [Fusarium graminearum]|eukprot:XP_011316107.1 hypothetical protein FGSG_00438 [Fusarium graminearum PH-1]
MDRLANQGQSEGAGAGDLAKNMQDAPASASASPLPTSNPNDGSPGKSGGGGLSDSNPGNSGDSDSGEDAVQFDTQLFNFSPVFIADAELQKKDFTFEASNKTTLEKVTWQVVHNSKVDTLGSYNFKSAKRDFNQFIEVTNTTVSLNFTGETEQFYGDNMHIEINWTKDGLEGATKSRLFTITNNETEKLELESKLQKDQKQQGPAETTFSPDSSSTSGSIAPTGTTEASDSSSGGGGGLSTGATAGIAVGAVIGGLLLIGALVWFLLRRRRNKHPSEDYTIQQTYAVDKEINGRTSDSPNSPYSDENHMQPIALGNVDRDRGVAPTPPPGRSSVASHDRGANSGAQTPQGMSSNVAHLVEDGMTADEIRRLEEEERQLDDEIERAARR